MPRVLSATRGLKHRAAPPRGWAVSGPTAERQKVAETRPAQEGGLGVGVSGQV